MNNYNDGLWHGWNGGGECPVHPESMVECEFYGGDDGGFISEARQAETFAWNAKTVRVVAFRVIKAYKEPREFWLVGAGAVYNSQEKAEHVAKAIGGCEIIHVREVLK